VSDGANTLNLDWKDHAVESRELSRPTDLSEGRGNAGKSERILARSRLIDVEQ
jgi:hypothetical protein